MKFTQLSKVTIEIGVALSLFFVLLSLFLFPSSAFGQDQGQSSPEAPLEEQHKYIFTGNYCTKQVGVSLRERMSDTITVTVPEKPKAAFWFWSGRQKSGGVNTGDNTIILNGNTMTANIEESSKSPSSWTWYAYIFQDGDPEQNLLPQTIQSGLMTFTVGGLNIQESHGIGLLIIYEDAEECPLGETQIYFGIDVFFRNWLGEFGPNSAMSCFDFLGRAAGIPRNLVSQLVVGGVESDQRTNSLWTYTTNQQRPPNGITPGKQNCQNTPATDDCPFPGAIEITDPLNSSPGREFDFFPYTLTVPAGDTLACFQIESPPGGDRYSQGISANWFGQVMNWTFPTGSITGTIWLDSDGDGVQKDGEGIDGVTVYLKNSLGITTLATTTTQNSGNYLFAKLPEDNYTIEIDKRTFPGDVYPIIDPDDVLDNKTVIKLDFSERQIMDNINFGYQQSGVIGGRIWYDNNGNGKQESGEAGIPGVTINLLDANGVFRQYLTIDGTYRFTNLTPTTYIVAVVIETLPPGVRLTFDPDGNNDHRATVSLAMGESHNDIDFGYLHSGSIGGYIWYDDNGNGQQESGEGGIPGVTVTLLDADGGFLQSYTTTTGVYTFSNLAPAIYIVQVVTATLPSGARLIHDPDGGNDHRATVPLAPGENRTDIDFGYQRIGAIGDRLWYNDNANNLQESGEASITYTVTVNLLDANGVKIANDMTTNGVYGFNDLAPATYIIQVVTETLPAGVRLTFDPDGGNDHRATVPLAPGQSRTDIDFGYQRLGAIGDRLWYDDNGDGLQDNKEVSITYTVTVNLLDVNGTFLASQTITNGVYGFNNLVPATYIIQVVTETLPAGVRLTFDPDGGNDHRAIVQLKAGDNRSDIDFGYQRSALIGDLVWYDDNGDGDQDSGENGIPSITVNLLNANSGFLQSYTTTTGVYTFSNLVPATYIVQVVTETLSSSATLTFDPDGGNDHRAVVSVAAGEKRTDIDFGYQRIDAIGDRLWYDDGDGEQEIGERGIPSVTVNLLDANRSSLRSDVTDLNGVYGFENLVPTTYTIQIVTSTLPLGAQLTFDPDGGNDHAATVSLVAGTSRNDIDFGYRQTPVSALALAITINDQIATAPPGPYLQWPGEAAYTYVVKNVGNTTLTKITVTDSVLGAISCANITNATLVRPGDNILCTAGSSIITGTQSSLAIAAGSRVLDTGLVSPEVVSTTANSYYVGYYPALVLGLTVNGEDGSVTPGPLVPLGENVIWNHTVTNTGEITLKDIKVSAVDDSDSVPNDGSICIIPELTPGSFQNCSTISTVQPSVHKHVAQATGQPTDQTILLGKRITTTTTGYYWSNPIDSIALVVTPPVKSVPVGLPHSVTATIQLNGQPPTFPIPIHFQVQRNDQITHRGVSPYADDTGRAFFTYTQTDNDNAGADQVVAWINGASSQDDATEDISDQATVHWQRVALTNTDTISAIPEEIRVVTAYVYSEVEGRVQAAVAGLRVGFTATVASGQTFPTVFGVSDAQGSVPFTITAESVASPAMRVTVSAPASAAGGSASDLASSPPFIDVTDVITLWVDTDQDNRLRASEPHELVDATTAVKLASVTYHLGEGRITFAWTTAVADSYVGFNIYRATMENDLGNQLNLDAIGSDQTSSTLYHYQDGPLAKGVYYYWLEGIGYHGNGQERFGPFMVVVGDPLYLPLIHRP